VSQKRPPHRRWQYDVESAAYRNLETGAILPPNRLYELLTDFLSTQAQRIVDETQDLVAGYSTITEWEVGMRRVVKETWGASYLLGRGGRQQMTYSDWGKVGRMVRDQYLYLNRFARQIAAKEVSAEKANQRAVLYVNGARHAMSKGHGTAMGDVPLPAYPGDGSTSCMNNCGCSWDIAPDPAGGWRATWVMGDTDHCADCSGRAERWAPLYVGGPVPA
jgi:hypothetical protein